MKGRKPAHLRARATTPVAREAGRRATTTFDQLIKRTTNLAIYGGSEVPDAAERPDVTL